MLSVLALLMLLCMLLSACGSVFGSTENAEESALDGVASYVDGIAGSVANGTIFDWVYETLTGKGLPATSAYKTMSSVTSTTFSATNGYSTTSTFYSLSATNTTYLALSGCKNPSQNGNKYYRLNYADRASYPGSIDTNDKGSGVSYLATQTAGVAVRLCTDATSIAIQATMRNCSTAFNHMSKKGIYGFDIYVGTGTNRTWVTNTAAQIINDGADGSVLTGFVSLPSGYKEVLIMFPQYGGVSSVNIGLPGTAKIAKPNDRSAKDVCFYGTSITQGCASNRAGTSYTNILGRTLDVNVCNLGFSGSGKGEPVMATYIANRVKAGEFSAVVLDFERNGSLQELVDWHYNFYKTIRAASSSIPIILVTRPIFTATPDSNALSYHSVVANTYQMARMAGDSHIYMLNGYEYFSPGMADLYTVDNTHPNDLGHYFMANKLYPYLYNVLYGDPTNIPEPKLGEFNNAGQNYYAPFGYAEGAKKLAANWQPGFVAPTDQRSGANYDSNTNVYNKKTNGVVSSAYSYSNVLTFPKKGTKVWFHTPGYNYTAPSVALLSYAVQESGVWKFDATRATVVGQGTAGSILYNSDGSVYLFTTPATAAAGQYTCYITQKDNESIRFTVQTSTQTNNPTDIYYVEPTGATIHFKDEANFTKTKVDVKWNGNKYLQWDSGMLDQDMPFATSDIITIPKAGTTLVWFDDMVPDPGYTGTTIFDVNRAYAGGTVAIAAFDSAGNYLPNVLRLRASNGAANEIKYGTPNCFVTTLDGTMRVYYYTTTKDNEQVRISYHAGFDTDINNSDKSFFVPPYDVYMYVPNN